MTATPSSDPQLEDLTGQMSDAYHLALRMQQKGATLSKILTVLAEETSLDLEERFVIIDLLENQGYVATVRPWGRIIISVIGIILGTLVISFTNWWLTAEVVIFYVSGTQFRTTWLGFILGALFIVICTYGLIQLRRAHHQRKAKQRIQ